MPTRGPRSGLHGTVGGLWVRSAGNGAHAVRQPQEVSGSVCWKTDACDRWE